MKGLFRAACVALATVATITATSTADAAKVKYSKLVVKNRSFDVVDVWYSFNPDTPDYPNFAFTLAPRKKGVLKNIPRGAVLYACLDEDGDTYCDWELVIPMSKAKVQVQLLPD